MPNLMTPEMAYEGYYAVQKETVESGGIFEGVNFKAISPDLSALAEDLVNKFVHTINGLIQFEAKKERAFLLQYYEKYKGIDSDLEKQLKQYLFSEPAQLSKAFELVEIHRHKIANEYNNLELNLEKWDKEYLTSFNNKFFVDTCTEAIQKLDNMGAMTPEQVLNYMIQYVQEKYPNEAYRINFNHFMETYAPALTDIVRNTKSFQGKLWTLPINSIKFVKDGEPNQAIQDAFISKIVAGLVNGLGQEEFLVSLGGASTARATNKLTFFLPDKRGKSKTMNLPTETDVYMALTGDFQINEDVRNAITAAKTNKDIRDIINNSAYDDFVIHFSSKDLSIAESGGGAVNAKLKGEGSLDAKIRTLEELGAAMNASSQVHELIFEAVNTGAELLYSNSGTIDDVSRGLTSLTFGFMFEDFAEQIEQMNTQSTTNELHIYMISGQYFTISEVLKVLRDQIISWRGSPTKLINIGFKPAPISYYEQLKNTTPEGITRWNAVREATIKNTMMKVMMNVTNLRAVLDRSL